MARPKNSKERNFATPEKPKGLSVAASTEWDRIIKEIEASGLQITPAHRAAVSLAATIAADIHAAWIELEGGRETYVVRPNGGIDLHPAAKRMDALRRDYIKVLSVIGLRPGTSAESTEGETLEDMLNG